MLLPTVKGHGLSIKAVEAMSCGAPLIATPQSVSRHGASIRAELANVTLREDAAGFAAALREAAARARGGPRGGKRRDERHATAVRGPVRPAAYAAALAGAVAALSPEAG